LIGYRRLEGIVAAEILSRLYAASCPFANFFQPSFKLAEKPVWGRAFASAITPPATPAARHARVGRDTQLD
jgi:hypothetical protein